MNKKILHYANLLFCIIILLPDLKNQLMFCLLMSYRVLFPVLFIVTQYYVILSTPQNLRKAKQPGNQWKKKVIL